MRVAMLTREYPPEVYGGAGVHVTELTRHLRSLVAVDVHCMGAPRADAIVHDVDPRLRNANPAIATLSADLDMAASVHDVDLVHSHTWYTGLAGHLAKDLHGIPHVLTAHSLEPSRPWKAEQLGGGYRVSSWVERTAIENADAVIAVSNGMRADVCNTYPRLDPEQVHVVRNGIDATLWQPRAPGAIVAALGLDTERPIAMFVGRITRQKGVRHLVAAAHHFAPEVQLVLCAGAPDTPEIGAEIAAAVEVLAQQRQGVHWISEMLPQPQISELLSAATVFVCPSIYEPLGIVNLEAMACGTAVVGSAVGGIPEVIADQVTGTLVPYAPDDVAAFELGLAQAVNEIVADPAGATAMGDAGRSRVIEHFSWSAIAEQTVAIYRALA